MSRHRLQKWLVTLSLSLLLMGCQSLQSGAGVLPNVADKQITVLDNPEKTAYEESSINSLVRVDGVRGMDWLSEEELIVERENASFPAVEADGEKWLPYNMYLHSLLTNEQTPLYPENTNQGFAQVSPDRTKLFYKTFDLQSNTGQGYLMDLSSRQPVALTEKDAMDIQNGRWVDNNSVVYASIDGTIYLAHAGSSSAPQNLIETQIPFVSNVFYMGNRLYYSALEGNLLSHAVDQKPSKSSLNNILSMTPSPDEQRLAVVRRIKGGNVQLVITDLQGTILSGVAQDTQIYGTAWSPDGSRLAYAAYAPNGTVRGIYVADATTGQSNLLPVDIKFIADPLRWSPTGNRIMISSTQPDEQRSRNRFVTYLVRVSSL